MDDADVVVLNTCCIRENADNKLYGHLGHAEGAQGHPPRARDRGRRLPGPEGPRPHPGAGRPRRRGARHPQRAPGRRPAGAGPRSSGPVTEIWEEALDDADAFPSALPAKREVAVRGVGHHPDRLRQLVRLLHRARGAGSRDQPALRRAGGRGRAPGRRRRGRGHPARPERELLRPRPHHPPAGRGAERRRPRPGRRGVGRRPRSPAPPAVRRPARRGGGGRGHPPGPLHQPPPQGPAARDHRGHGRRTRRSARTCTCRCSRAATGSWPPCTAGYTAERYLEKLAAARAAIADLAVTTDIIVGFPGETDDDFARTLEVAAAAEYDSAYTFIYSPRSGTEAAELVDQYVDPAVVAERFERLRVVVERSALAKHEARIGRTEEVVVEGPSKRDPAVTSGRTAPEQAGALPRRPRAAAGHDRRGAGHRRRTALPAGRAASRSSPPPRHRTRIPVAAG